MNRRFILVVGSFAVLFFCWAFQYQLPAAVEPEVARWRQSIEAEQNNPAAKDSILFWSERIIDFYQKKGQPEKKMFWYAICFDAIINIGNLSYEERLEMLNKKLAEVQDANNPNVKIDYELAKLELNVAGGDFDSAFYNFEQLKPLIQECDDPQKKAYWALLGAELYLDDLSVMESYKEQAGQLLEKHALWNNSKLGVYYHQLSSVLAYEKSEYEKVIKINLELLEKYAFKLDNTQKVSAYGDIAAAYCLLEDYESAMQYYNKTVELNEMDDVDLNNKIISLSNLTNFLISNNQHEEALSFCKKNLLYVEQVQNAVDKNKNKISIYMSIRNIYQSLDNYDSSFLYIRKAEEMSKATNNYLLHVVYTSYQGYYLTKKDYSKSIEYGLKALDFFASKGITKKRDISQIYRLLVSAYQEQGAWSKAKDALMNMFRNVYIEDDFPEDIREVQLKNVFVMEEFQRGMQLALKLFRASLDSPDNPLKVTEEQLFAYAKLAAQSLEYQVSGFKSEGSKMSKLNKKAQFVYEQAIRLAIRLFEKNKDKRYFQEAFQLAEQSKSMLLMDALQEAHAANFAGIPDSLLERERILQRQIGKAEKMRVDARLSGDQEGVSIQEQILFDLQHQAKALEHLFEQSYPEYYDLKYALPESDLDKIQSKIDENTLILEYVEGEEDYYLLVLGKQYFDLKTLKVDSADRNDLLAFLRNVMDVQGAKERPLEAYNLLTRTGRSLAERLLPDIPEGIERLVIVCDGQLSYLPFDVLLSKPAQPATDEGQIDYRNLEYLLRRYRLNYNYSVQLWLHQKEAKEQVINGRILAMASAYPPMDTAGSVKRNAREQKTRLLLDDLPGARSEVEALSKAFDGEFLYANDANERYFKQSASRFGILHLAMHGLVDSKDPEYSSLAFTENNDSTVDNFLYAYEIKQLSLKAGLVVLSACETGLGKYQRGEGVVSIGRGFLYAGAPALLMTLWSLNDKAGADLIGQFYKNLQMGMDKDQAIRQAKLDYLTTHKGLSAHPALWACFVQVGDYDPIFVSGKPSGAWLWWLLGGVLAVGAAAWALRRGER